MAKNTGADAGAWMVDLSSWESMEPIMDWQEKVGRGDFRGMSEIMAGVVKAWPFEGDPQDVANYRQLTITQWKQAAQQVGNTIGAFFQGAA